MVIKVNNKDKKNLAKDDKKKKEKSKENSYSEEYGYDFVPSLNEWLNIDEQRENAKRLEDI